MLELTKEEKAYILEMLHNNFESLQDLELWEDQNLMTPEEIADEYKLINGIAEKLRDEA